MLILAHITAPNGGRILDPCAGKGTALVTLSEPLNLEPFGVELHEERADAAKAVIAESRTRAEPFGKLKACTESVEVTGSVQELQIAASQTNPKSGHQTRILNDSYLNLITSKNGYNLLYLNPPYDWDSEDGRLEYQWLWRTRPYLQPGGLLVYVVQQHILKMRKAAKYIASHYEQVRVYRFPDREYERFKQIVLFGVRRAKGIVPDAAAVDALIAMGQQEEIGLLPQPRVKPLTIPPEPFYTLPPLIVKENAFKFRSMFVDPADALAEAQQMGASTTDAWQQHLSLAGVNVQLRPLTPLKIGHMNSIIAAGHMNNQVLEACTEQGRSDGDKRRLLIKGRSYKSSREESYEEPLPSGGKKLTTLQTEVVVTDITTIDRKGEIQSHNGPGLEQFLSQWIGKLTHIVANDYPPVYQFNMNGYGALLGGLSKERAIPGLNGQTGLLPAQKHAAAAVLTRLETHPDAIVVGEMGCGKTTIGAGIAAGRKAQRTIVLCPPHLVDKWQREFKAVWPGVITMHLQTISDVDAFFTERRDHRPIVGVLKQTTARSASGWEHAYDYGGTASHSYGSKGFSDVIRPWGDKITANHAVGDEEKTLTPKQLQNIHQRGVGCPVCGTQQRVNDRPLSPREMKGAKRFCTNIACHAPLFQFKRRRSGSQQRGSFKLYAEREKLIRSYTDKGQPVPFHERNYWGGKASSIFHLLYRMSPEMTAAYTDPDASGRRRIRSKEWVASYGILQRIETRKLDEDGKQTANSRSNDGNCQTRGV